ncbi:hypothetical protein CXB51_028353 [Gossypium anomalum]|uniref:Glycosyltransferase 7 n=1 Tax=Gossypium anomalum TaxID=47600 RepID=A0A8J6CKL4_9ROSI|nr:hypothetical protein CXB51_028353 [Gossypium anomalum]
MNPDLSHFQSSAMAKLRSWSFWSHLSDAFLFFAAAFLALVLVWSFWSYFTPTPNFLPTFTHPSSNSKNNPVESAFGVNLESDPKDPTFYDDPEMSYSIEKPVKDWDGKRKEWFKHHPSFAAGARERIVLVTGSQPKPCKNPVGDHLLLRLFKNKVDYCRIHGCDVFYNNLLLHPKMKSFWAKFPIVKAAMLAHPEAEWIWWVDSDALFTDMEFKLPLERYKNHNLVVNGWPELIYNKTSWTSLNAGVFLVRNCQWSMDLISTWSNMGPISEDYEKWGQIQRSMFKDKLFPESDDQSALIYLLYKEKEKYYDHIYLEKEFYFQGYWVDLIGVYDNTTERYLQMERKVARLRRRHAEKVSEQYAAFREEFLKETGKWKRPFITHFTGCEPCSGNHNQKYDGETCWKGMVKALNFADNQILRNYGFLHSDLLDSSTVTEVPFDYPNPTDAEGFS